MNRTILSSTIIVMLFTMISRFSGFVREIAIGYFFGASMAMDTFLVAFMIPNAIGAILETSIASVLLPKYLEYKKEENDDNKKALVSTMVLFICCISSLLVLGLYLFSENIINVLAPGFSLWQKENAAKMLNIMLPSVLCYGLFGICSAVLQAERRFSLISLASLPFNIASITVTWFLYQLNGIVGLAWGSTAGAVVQLLFVWLGTKQYKFSVKKINRACFYNIWKRLFAVVLTSIFLIIPTFIDRIIGSWFDAGSIAALNYANRVSVLFVAVLINPMITVLFPELSDSCLSGGKKLFNQLVGKILRILIYLMTPLVLLLIFFSTEIIEILFFRGAFSYEAIKVTGGIFFIYSISLIGCAFSELMKKVYYSQQKFKLPIYVTVLVVVLHFIFAVGLSDNYGIYGLAIAYSLSMFFGGICYLGCFWLANIDNKRQTFVFAFKFVCKIFIGGGVMCGGYYHINIFFVEMLNICLLLRISIESIILLIGYLFVTQLLGCEETHYVLETYNKIKLKIRGTQL